MARSDIEHYAGLESWNPVRSDALWTFVAAGAPFRGARVLDVGCGRATTLVRCATEFDAVITGLDRSAAALTLARATAARLAPDADATWIEAALDDAAFEPDAFDLILAIGGPYKNEVLEDTLRLYAGWLAPGGTLVYGDGFWMQPPPARFLEATGLPADALFDREAYLALARQCGWVSHATLTASREDWDHFEHTLLRNHEAYVAAHPDDEDAQQMIVAKRTWADAQERWGRKVMGFSLDRFRAAGDEL